MHLDTLKLTEFRSFHEATVRFQPFLTVLAGENNAGKTNILEALRLFTMPVDGRQTRYPDMGDIRRGAESFSLAASFAGLDIAQRGTYVAALESPGASTAQYGMRFRPPEGKSRRGRIDRWAGKQEGADPEPEAREYIRHVHLPALRDAQRELASANPERIAFLLRQMSGGDDLLLEEFTKTANQAFEAVAEQKLVTDAAASVTKGLDLLTRGVQPHVSDLRPSALDLRQVARHLQFHLQRTGFPAIDLTESGLGYANLLFLATVLVELSAADDADLTLFLVEEPEAHLHPQLQAATLSYLRDRAAAAATRKKKDGEPGGAIQVIVTTHSPNLASAVSSKHLVVLRSGDEASGAEGGRGNGSRAVAVADLNLAPDDLSRVDRYLDVTRAALFFSSRVMLVEGIAEALLLPPIAQSLHGKKIISDVEYARFRAATILAIDGVDFAPYVELLVKHSADSRIADKVVIVTDGDPKKDEEVPAGTERMEALLSQAATLGASDAVRVFLSKVTLEADLLLAGNRGLLREVFLASRPKSAAKFDAIPSTNDAAAGKALVEVFESSRIRKGDFAQAVASRITGGAAFDAPTYLVDAVKELVR